MLKPGNSWKKLCFMKFIPVSSSSSAVRSPWWTPESNPSFKLCPNKTESQCLVDTCQQRSILLQQVLILMLTAGVKLKKKKDDVNVSRVAVGHHPGGPAPRSHQLLFPGSCSHQLFIHLNKLWWRSNFSSNASSLSDGRKLGCKSF